MWWLLETNVSGFGTLAALALVLYLAVRSGLCKVARQFDSVRGRNGSLEVALVRLAPLDQLLPDDC